MFDVQQRQAHTPHAARMLVRPMEHDTGDIIANAFHVTTKAALGEGGLDPS
jgi:hypothetical protein